MYPPSLNRLITLRAQSLTFLKDRHIVSPSISDTAPVIAIVRPVSSPQRFSVVCQPLSDIGTLQEWHSFGIHLYNGRRIQIAFTANATIDFKLLRNTKASLKWRNEFDMTGTLVVSRTNVAYLTYLLSVEEGDYVFVFAKEKSTPVANVTFEAEYMPVT